MYKWHNRDSEMDLNAKTMMNGNISHKDNDTSKINQEKQKILMIR